MTWANRITIFRIVLIPVFAALFLQQNKYPGLEHWTLGVFSLAVITDFLDGLVARLKKEHTRLGTFLDPVADKLLILSTFILLTYSGQVDLWVLVVVFFRDLIIVLGWVIIYILTSSTDVQPRWLGKTSTFMQMSTAIAILFPLPELLQIWLVRGMILTTMASAVDYMAAASKRLEPIPK